MTAVIAIATTSGCEFGFFLRLSSEQLALLITIQTLNQKKL
jgi:hypothetical protein